MKKFLLLSIGLVFCLLSCTNENDLIELESSDEITNEIIYITKGYLKSQPNNNGRLSPAAAIRAVDVGAYWESRIGGSNAEDATYDGYDASVAAYEEFKGSIPPPPPPGDVSHSANPLDYVGDLHVDILDYIIKEPSGIFINGNGVNFGACINYGNSVFNSLNLPSYSGTAASLEQFVVSTNATIANANYLLSSLVTVQSNADQILKNYFLAFEGAQNVQGFVDYSKQIELMVIGSQGFSNQEKELLLGVMATARHDLNYWGI